MILRDMDGLKVLQCERLLELGVVHGWFGVSLGNTMLRDTMTPDEIAGVKMQWDQACHLLGMDAAALVKTTGLLQTEKVMMIKSTDAGKTVGEADGYVTAASGVPVLLRAADCMQIIIYEPKAKVMALIHAGGRGVASHVLRNTLRLMGNLAADPTKMVVAIGPAIAPEHFIPTMAVDHFTLSDIREANPVAVSLPDGRVGYDIAATARQELLRLGVPGDAIEISGIDTFSSPEFYSSERDRVDRPQAAMCRNGLFASLKFEA